MHYLKSTYIEVSIIGVKSGKKKLGLDDTLTKIALSISLVDAVSPLAGLDRSPHPLIYLWLSGGNNWANLELFDINKKRVN